MFNHEEKFLKTVSFMKILIIKSSLAISALDNWLEFSSSLIHENFPLQKPLIRLTKIYN